MKRICGMAILAGLLCQTIYGATAKINFNVPSPGTLQSYAGCKIAARNDNFVACSNGMWVFDCNKTTFSTSLSHDNNNIYGFPLHGQMRWIFQQNNTCFSGASQNSILSASPVGFDQSTQTFLYNPGSTQSLSFQQAGFGKNNTFLYQNQGVLTAYNFKKCYALSNKKVECCWDTGKDFLCP